MANHAAQSETDQSHCMHFRNTQPVSAMGGYGHSQPIGKYNATSHSTVQHTVSDRLLMSLLLQL
jgi:hypothetical protein